MPRIKLDYPVKADGATLNEIELRRPTVKDMRVASAGGRDGAEAEITLLANLSQLTPDTIESLDLADYIKLQDALSGFSGKKKTT
jgi:hypothetical protein